MTLALLDEALASAALDVAIALGTCKHRYRTRAGTGKYSNTITVLDVAVKELGRIDYIVQRAALPFFGQCRHFKTYIVIQLVTQRDYWMRERHLERHGDGGFLLVVTRDDRMQWDRNERGQAKPLIAGPRDEYGG